MIFNEDQYLENYCVKCEKYIANAEYKYCKPCQIDWLKKNFTNWTSKNKQIDDLIQEMQLNISNYKELIFEWIPYYQFNDIKKLSVTTYSAKWKNDSLLYDYYYKNKYIRNLANKAIILKYLVNSQNITSEFINEVNFYKFIFLHFL
jgi:hypothetical protein